MTYTLASTQVWVLDQDEALDFYTKVLGMEVRMDVSLPEMGGFRWLSVGPVGQPDVAIVLMLLPPDPVMDEPTREQIRELMAKGIVTANFLVTDDVYAAYDELTARGLEFLEKPEERPYGIDAGFRDPWGNHFRLTQLKDFG